MSKHMTIINLACTITKLRKWGEAWKHSAESAQAATARMHQANKDLERAKVITDGLVDKLIADRDAAWTERDTQAADHSRQLTEHRAAFGARTEADAKIIAGLRSEIVAARMAVLERDSLMSERDGLLTQVQDMRAEMQRLSAQLDWERAEIKRLQWENLTMHKDAEDDPPIVKREPTIGDTVRLVKIPIMGAVSPELQRVLEWPWIERWGTLNQTALVVEPAYQLEGALSVCLRTNVHVRWPVCCIEVVSEANHDTEAGKAVAESAVRTEPVAEEIKVGDVAKVVGASGDLTAQSDIGKIGEVLKIDFGDGTVRLSGAAGWVDQCDVRKVTT